MGDRRRERRDSTGRRSTDLEHETLAELVGRATGHALDERWRKMVAAAFLSSVMAALMVALPITLGVTSQATDNAKANSRYNCQVARGLAQALGSGNTTNLRERVYNPSTGKTTLESQGFLSSDARLRDLEEKLGQQQAILTGENKLFGKTLVGKIMKEAHRVDTDATNYWLHTLIPAIDSIARVNCQAVLPHGK